MKNLYLIFLTVFLLQTASSQITYTFTGNGNWTTSTNWSSNTVPPQVLPSGSQIYVSPASGDSCILNTTQTISSGASLTITTGAKFIIIAGVSIRSLPTITTNSVSVIRDTAAIAGGIIEDNGGSPVTSSGLVWSTTPYPTVATSSKSVDGTSTGYYYSNLFGLQKNTTYYVRAYATNSLGTNYGSEINFRTMPNDSSIIVCSMEWQTKNLEVSKYANGDPVPEVKDAVTFLSLTTGAWSNYNNDPANAIYGKLYNFYAVKDPRGLAPAGWHIASDSEWVALSTCLGSTLVAGGKMKEIGTTHWSSPNTGATNISGFTALPSGWGDALGNFLEIGLTARWWTATELNGMTFTRQVSYSNTRFAYSGLSFWNMRFPVRCVRNY